MRPRPRVDACCLPPGCGRPELHAKEERVTMPTTGRIAHRTPTQRGLRHTRPFQRQRRGVGRAARSPETAPATKSVAVFRMVFALVWLVDAILKWLPGFRSGFSSMLDQAATGQPGWLRPWFDLWTDMPHGMTTAMAYGTAVVETGIALALLVGFARKSVYLLGSVYSLLIWATAEGFGGPYQSGSTDVGAAVALRCSRYSTMARR